MNKWTFKVKRHEFELLLVRTEHYKRFFSKRCFFEFVNKSSNNIVILDYLIISKQQDTLIVSIASCLL